jgi:hypothetical protein
MANVDILEDINIFDCVQMERLRVLSEGKQGRYPSSLDSMQEIRQLLGDFIFICE